jgi:UDP-N-acetylglucosamine diphosphorylase/glucosamine-1-phosphate N-acetyltransferase
MIPYILFDDGQGMLAPLTDLRAAFEIRTGALTTLDRTRALLGGSPSSLYVPAHLADLVASRQSVPVNVNASEADVIALNGRAPLAATLVKDLAPGQALAEEGSGNIIAARTNAAGVAALARGETPEGVAIAGRLPAPSLISRPWHVRTFRDACLAVDLDTLTANPGRVPPEGVLRMGDAPLRCALTARICPGVTLDLEGGPILIGDNAVIRPGAVLIGPCAIGDNTTVLERATIRPKTAIGPWCKVNGEVGGVIFQGYSNKAHDGYLGDSWVGEWVNLGAGTTNSNLLNTYGEIVAVAAQGSKYERTAERFLGAIIGDHVKTAIGTRIMTACVLHTGGMFAATAPVSGATPPFAWATDDGVRRYRPEKFLEVARAMMQRRNVEPTPAYMDRLRALATAAAGENTDA